MVDALEKAIALLGGPGKAPRVLDVTPMAISHWRRRGVPPLRAKQIEELTGGRVRRADLLPELFG